MLGCGVNPYIVAILEQIVGNNQLDTQTDPLGKPPEGVVRLGIVIASSLAIAGWLYFLGWVSGKIVVWLLR
jgi:hypothetical protein